MENLPMNSTKIEEASQSFWYTYVSKLNSKTHLAIQFKVQLDDCQFRSISNVQIVTLEEYPLLKELFISSWLDCDDFYHSLSIKNIIFSYKNLLVPNHISEQKKAVKLLPKISKRKFGGKSEELAFFYKGKNKLPITIDIEKWGEVLSSTELEAIVKYDKTSKAVSPETELSQEKLDQGGLNQKGLSIFYYKKKTLLLTK